VNGFKGLVGVAGFEPATPTSRTKPPIKRCKENQRNSAPKAADRSFSVHGKAGPPQKPPDPQNGSPASAGTERGADRKKPKFRSPRKTTRRPRNSQAANASLAVYNGQKLLGLIARTDRGFDAYLADQRFLSSHATLKEAADAAVDAAATGGGL